MPEKRTSPRVSRSRLVGLCATLSFSVSACETMAPALTTALIGFGQDVLASAAQNFTPQYAGSMQNLLLALAETATGAPFTETDEAEEEYSDDDGYSDYTDDGGYASDDEYYDDAVSQDDYDDTEPAYTDSPLADDQEYADAGRDQGIRLDAAILAQQRTRDNQVTLRPVRDGDVLYDGRGDPARGDKVKFFFETNCDCFVYIIGIDATGYVAQIFPEGDLANARPVRAGREYLVPGGTTWWGLDDYRGIENIYFVASRSRRGEIERIVSNMAGTRPPVAQDFRPVSEPAIVPVNRGLVQVQSAAPTSVPTEFGGSQSVDPTSFQSTLAGADLVVSRWFRHE